MKKVIFALCVFVVCVSQAQYDTLPHTIGIPNYYTNHSLDSLTILRHDDFFCLPKLYHVADTHGGDLGYQQVPYHYPPVYGPNGDFAFGFYPDSTIHVIGIAWTMWLGTVSNGDSSVWYWDTIVVKLLQPVGGGRMNVLCRKTIIRDTFSYSKVMDYSRGWSEWDSLCLTSDGRFNYTYDPLYEVFFDREYDIRDSLYLSVKLSWVNSPRINGFRNIDFTRGWAEFHTPFSVVGPFAYPTQSFRMKNTPGEDDPWTYGEIHAYPMLFPIVRLDGDTCPEVQNVHFIKAGSSAAIAMWDEGVNHRDWQFYIGPQGALPNEEEAVTDNVPRHLLNGLSPTAHYDVYVRARCRFVRGDEWSSWTGPIDLCMATIGIDEADIVEWSLTPNPAHGSVTVQCDEGIKSVDLLSVKGETVQRRNAAGAYSCTLDITGMAKGIYIVQITTPQGTSVRKLAVE